MLVEKSRVAPLPTDTTKAKRAAQARSADGRIDQVAQDFEAVLYSCLKTVTE